MTTLYRLSGGTAPLYDLDGNLLSGGGNNGPRYDPSLLTEYRQVATHTGWRRLSKTTESSGRTHIVKHKIMYPARGLRLQHAGVAGQAWVWVNGTTYDVTWDGKRKLSGLGKDERRISDPIPDDVIVLPGDDVRTIWQTDPGTIAYTGDLSGPGAVTRIYDRPWDRTITPPDVGNITGGPVMIYGYTTPEARAFAAFGDSILQGGWIRSAADSRGRYNWSDTSVWLAQIPSADLPGRLSPGDPQTFTLGLMEHGTNHRTADGNIAPAQALLIQAWTWLTAGPVKRLGQTTMTPYTRGHNGDNSFSTLDGQTETNAAWRNNMNAWLKDGAPMSNGAAAPVGSTGAVRAGEDGHPLVGVCDITPAVEATNSRGETVWRVDQGVLVTDGTHPTAKGNELLRVPVERWLDQVDP